MWAHMCHCVCVEVSGQLVGVSLPWVLGTELGSLWLGGRPVPTKSSCQNSSVYSRECGPQSNVMVGSAGRSHPT